MKPFVTIFKRFKRNKIRKMMRDYRALKKVGELDRISHVKQLLTTQPLGILNKEYSPLIFGNYKKIGEPILKQYLLTEFSGINFNYFLLESLNAKNKLSAYPLPLQWRIILEQNGFNIDRFKSAILWHCQIFRYFTYGIYKIAYILYEGILLNNSTKVVQKPYAYFSNLNSSCIPPKNDLKSKNIINWYLKWPGRNNQIRDVYHGVEDVDDTHINDITICGNKLPIPAISNSKTLAKFFFWAVKAITFSIFDLFRGHWWSPFLLSQSALAAQVSLSPKETLAREYLFNNSGWIYRPLWTYEAEGKGSSIIFYFYSINVEMPKKNTGYPPVNYGLTSMTWPKYLVWDNYLADFVRRVIGTKKADIDIVGPIWFETSNEEIPDMNQPYVAIFDVIPRRESKYRLLAMDSNLYSVKVSHSFLDDISDLVKKYNHFLYLKRKRDIGSAAHPVYRSFVTQLADENRIILLSSKMSVNKIIESSSAVISMPFTSTAVIAKEMGKPSVFYDSEGVLIKGDRAAHGIKIITSKHELDQWLLSVIGKGK